jgi:hypothetical protein
MTQRAVAHDEILLPVERLNQIPEHVQGAKLKIDQLPIQSRGNRRVCGNEQYSCDRLCRGPALSFVSVGSLDASEMENAHESRDRP